MTSAPPVTQAAQLDIKAAYRCIPTLFAHQPHLVVSLIDKKGDIEIFIDRCHPFGLRSSGGNLGLALDATIDILTGLLAVAFWAKWVDDIIAIRHRCADGTYTVQLEDIISWFEFLGWPLSGDKIVDFATTITYLGFTWDFNLKTVAIPEAKREKYANRVSMWLSNARNPKCGVTREETERLLGTLVHCAFVHRTGRSFTSATLHFLSTFPTRPSKGMSERKLRFVHRFPSHEVISDIVVWHELLCIAHATRSLQFRPNVDPDIWVDASSEWGLAIVMHNRWRAWKLIKGWKADRRDIGWAESVALELAILHLIAIGYTQVNILVRSDNQGAIGQYNKGRGGNTPTNECIRRSVVALMNASIDITPEYVPSEDNVADGPSRGRDLNNDLRLPHAFDIPEALKSLIADV